MFQFGDDGSGLFVGLDGEHGLSNASGWEGVVGLLCSVMSKSSFLLMEVRIPTLISVIYRSLVSVDDVFLLLFGLDESCWRILEVVTILHWL